MFPDPITIPLLGLTLRPHNAFEILAVLVATTLVVLLARRLEGIPIGRMLLALLTMTVFEFLFGRLHYVLVHWDPERSSLLSVLRFWSSIHAGGAVLGAVAGALLSSRLFALPLGKLADACVPAAGVGIALARLGCFAHGCCYGSVCTLPWCFPWPKGTAPHAYQAERMLIGEYDPLSLPIHPLQLYFAAVGLCIGIAALLLYRRKRYDGQIALGALAGFAASTLLLEPLRDFPGEANWGPLSPLTWAALSLLAIALAGLALAGNRSTRTPSWPTAAGPPATGPEDP